MKGRGKKAVVTLCAERWRGKILIPLRALFGTEFQDFAKVFDEQSLKTP